MKPKNVGERQANLSAAKKALLEKLNRGQVTLEDPSRTIQKQPPSDYYPLSFSQERLWFIEQLEEGTPTYNLPAVVHFKGTLQIECLEQSLNAVMHRHQILQTSFCNVAGQVFQQVFPELHLTLPVVPLTHLTGEAQQAELRRLASLEAQQPFDLTKAPLLRVQLLQSGETDHTLLLTMHHIVSDGWSTGILVRELVEQYTALVEGKTPSLPEMTIQYRDFAAWQREWLQGDNLNYQLKYWTRRLGGPLPLLDLPTDRPRPAVKRDIGACHRFTIPAETTEKLNAFSRQAGVTLFMTLLSAVKTLAFRYTGQTDLILGTPIANRHHPQTEGLIGFFVNTLALRTDLAGNPSFRTVLARVQETALGAYGHQDVPFELLVKELRPERDSSRSPIFQVMFVLQNTPSPRYELAGLELSLDDAETGTAKFDMTWNLVETGDGLKGTIEYNTDLFDASTIARMAGHWQSLLSGVLENPDTAISDLPLLTLAEIDQLAAWNDTGKPYPTDRCLHHLIETQVEQNPAAVAVVADDETLTFAELEARANRVAGWLRAQSIGPEHLVGLHLERSAAMVVGFYGILKAGAAYVPLDPAYPMDRLEFMATDSGLAALVTQRDLAKPWGKSGFPVLTLDAMPDASWGGDTPPSVPLSPKQPAYVIYTSGSAGKSKGVVVEHASVVNLAFALRETAYANLEGTSLRVAVNGSLSFDTSVKQLVQLAFGHALCVIPEEIRFDGHALVAYLKRHQIEVFDCTPTQLRILLEGGLLAETELPLRLVLIGGEAIDEQLWNQCAAVPAIAFYNVYGPTECTVDTTVFHIQPGTVPQLGHPIPNLQTYVLDGQERLVPVGVPGELYIGGAGVARGYLNRPELTAERFVRVQGKTGEKIGSVHSPQSAVLYRTGDRVRRRVDGSLEFLNRTDDQVKLRGYRIELGEIETLLRQFPAVAEAVVVVREDQPGDQRLVAYLRTEVKGLRTEHSDSVSVLSPQSSVLEAGSVSSQQSAVLAWLRERLPDYMVPAAVVVLDAMPLTDNGKVNRRQLPAPRFQPSEASISNPPATDLEEAVAAVWQDVLGIPQVGRDQNFFDLGGHSLLLVRVHSQLREKFLPGLRMVELFKYPTVRSLAEFLDRANQKETVVAAAPAPIKPSLATADTDIAVIGMAGRFPGADSVSEFWENLKNGVESIRFFTPDELRAAGVEEALIQNPSFVPAGGTLAGIDRFDAAFFGFNPREAELLDPQQRVFMETAWHALEGAGYDPQNHPDRIGIFGGSGAPSYLLSLYSHRDVVNAVDPFQVLIGNEKDHVVMQTAYKLGLKGPALTVQTSCSTSLVAVHLACRSLLQGECRMALAGGVSIDLQQETGYLHQTGSILSPDGHCRAFDHRAQGTVGGSGVGLVVLKRLADAVADRDTVYAVIKGSAINNDGSQKVGYTAPSVDGQAQVIEDALTVAGVPAESIGYIETHGTGTVLGDPIEIAALSQAFSTQTRKRNFCAIGSVKTNVGHLNTAAGAAGLIKTALSLHHQTLLPSLNFEKPNPAIDFETSPFWVNSRLQPWETDQPVRRAGVSSFGIGGTNAHLVLEEAPRPAHRKPGKDWQLLTLSAKTETALTALSHQLAEHLEAHPELDAADVAFTLQAGRHAFPFRRSLVCQKLADAITVLREEFRTAGPTPESNRPGVAFIFSGQGSQYINMSRDLYQSETVFRQTIDRCAEFLEPVMGLDLRTRLFPIRENEEVAAVSLNQTAITQPALFVLEYALATLWKSWGVRPSAMLGHSLGEYTAACLAGVFSLEDGLKLVAARGRLMQQMPTGAMLSVQLPEADLLPFLSTEVSLAVSNAPGVNVVGGPEPAIQKLQEQLSQAGVTCHRLRTSHAFHTHMMEGMLDEFARLLETIPLQAPRIPFVSNVSGAFITTAEATSPAYWVSHVRNTVRFATGLETLLNQPHQIVLEVGPGKTLVSLAKQHPHFTRQHMAVPTLRHADDPSSDRAFLLRTAGQLWQAGVVIDWEGLQQDDQPFRIQLPGYPFERNRFWIEARSTGEKPTKAAASERKTDLADWFAVPTWKSAPLLPGHMQSTSQSWLVFADESGFGTALGQKLQQEGQHVVRVQPGTAFQTLETDVFSINPTQVEDYHRLLAELLQRETFPQHIVHAWTVSPVEHRQLTPDSFEAAQALGFDSLVWLAQALATKVPQRKLNLAVVSNGLWNITGEETLAPEKATLLGPALGIPQEFPNLTCRLVDLGLPANQSAAWAGLVGQLVKEIQVGSEPVALIGYRGRNRWRLAYEHVRLERQENLPALVKTGGHYLITGGTGGMGLEIASYLAEAAQAKLVLTSRTALPEAAAWDSWLTSHPANDPTSRTIRKVKQIQSLGAEVLVACADVADETAMRQVVEAAEHKWGPIQGVIHTAGTPGGGMLQLKTSEATRKVFRPKTLGGITIQQLFGPDQLDFLIFCSSLNAVHGGIGQVDYTAANAFLDALAQAAAGAGKTQVVAVNWPTWSEVGMAVNTPVPVEMEALKAENLKHGISSREGIEIFRRLFQPGLPPQLLVSPTEVETLIQTGIIDSAEFMARLTGSSPTETTQTTYPRPQLAAAYLAPRNQTEQHLVTLWQNLLGVEPVGVDDNFFELGGHSLLATQVMSRVYQSFSLELPLRTIFESPTVAELALVITQKQALKAEEETLLALLNEMELMPENVA